MGTHNEEMKGMRSMKRVIWMAVVFTLVLACGDLARGFAVPLDFGMRCGTADVIVRGVVVDIVPLVARGRESKRGEKEADDDFGGPMNVAIVRVTDVVKPGAETKIKGPAGLIYVPCGYNFDESPCELTDGKEYVLFLKAGGNNFFNAVDFMSTNRVVNGVVGMSGIDGDLDFDGTSEEKDRLPYEAFVKRVRGALDEAEPGRIAEGSPEPVRGKTLGAWGYESRELQRAKQGEWEEKEFGKAEVWVQSIRSVQQVKGWEDAYYRFRITRETYGSEEEAKRRIARVKDVPPGIDTKVEAHWALRDGRAAGKSAYIISTDVNRFAIEELSRLIGLLEKVLGEEK